jgi:hypothetical protein
MYYLQSQKLPSTVIFGREGLFEYVEPESMLSQIEVWRERVKDSDSVEMPELKI